MYNRPFNRSLYFIALIFPLFIVSCGDDNNVVEKIDVNPSLTEYTTEQLVDLFAIGALENYYLWADEEGREQLVESILNPNTCTKPIEEFKKALHKDDRWSMLTDDYKGLTELSEGIETTDGMDLTPMKYSSNSENVLFLVDFVYPNSPAEEAGIKRGDMFIKFNGRQLTTQNYKQYYNNKKQFSLGVGTIDRHLNQIIDLDSTVTMTPIHMYEEPIHIKNVFEINGKKVGYLAYMSFTDDTEKLKELFKEFKDEGISELILDLRYNGGGVVNTCVSLASMLAPIDVVNEEQVFTTNVYNKLVSQLFTSKTDTFRKEFLDANPDIKKIYAIVGTNTASASEMLLIGLMPYTDIVLIGEKTHGKFCSGIIIDASYVFKKEYWEQYKTKLDNWGVYVMIGSFADCKGKNPCQPNGLTPSVAIDDDPFDRVPLGDVNEVMLHKALSLAGMEFPEKADTRALTHPAFEVLPTERPSFAIMPDFIPQSDFH